MTGCKKSCSWPRRTYSQASREMVCLGKAAFFAFSSTEFIGLISLKAPEPPKPQREKRKPPLSHLFICPYNIYCLSGHHISLTYSSFSYLFSICLSLWLCPFYPFSNYLFYITSIYLSVYPYNFYPPFLFLLFLLIFCAPIFLLLSFLYLFSFLSLVHLVSLVYFFI